MKKILVSATIDEHIRHFHLPYIKWLREQGFIVDIASNGHENFEFVRNKYCLPFSKNPINPFNLIAFIQLLRLTKLEKYDYIHCHMPAASAIVRLMKIFLGKDVPTILYTAHGFHFDKRSGIINWLLYFPIEWVLSFFTDYLITINHEDYTLAKKYFKAKKIVFMNGVGIDFERFNLVSKETAMRNREKLNISDDEFIITYVAELSARKNQMLLMFAMKELIKKYPKIKLYLIGSGKDAKKLGKIIKDMKLHDVVILQGYTNQVPQFLSVTNCYVSTSKREGLPINLIEAMVMDLPIVASNCRGNVDLIKDEYNGLIFESNNLKELITAIERIIRDDKLVSFLKGNLKLSSDKYAVNNILEDFKIIYKEMGI